jgi:hypothetical protein
MRRFPARGVICKPDWRLLVRVRSWFLGSVSFRGAYRFLVKVGKQGSKQLGFRCSKGGDSESGAAHGFDRTQGIVSLDGYWCGECPDASPSFPGDRFGSNSRKRIPALVPASRTIGLDRWSGSPGCVPQGKPRALDRLLPIGSR